MICIHCDKTDGLCYASMPPNVKCTITGRFHLYDDPCDVQFEPVIEAEWIIHGENRDVFECSHCHSETWDEMTPRCPYCAAHMKNGGV